MNVYEVMATLARARRTAGLSQRAVAAKMGTTQSTVSDLESGTHLDPKWSTLARFAAAVGLELVVTVQKPAEPGGER